MWQQQPNQSSYRDSIKALQADIQHANTLAAGLPRDYGGHYIQMKLSYSPFAPFFLYLMEWMDYSCTDALPTYLGLLHVLVCTVYVDGMPSLSSKERKATLKEFYAVIYPSLRLLEGEFIGSKHNDGRSSCREVAKRKSVIDKDEQERERDNECGICMGNSMKMILPNCGHSLCNSCYHDWNMRSESCPFCRGSLQKVTPTDLWVAIGNNEVIDTDTLAKENLRRFNLYMETLPPLIIPETHVFVCNYML